MHYTLEQISKRLGATLEGAGEKLISGVGALDSATEEQISFADDQRFLPLIEQGAVGGVIVGEGFPVVAGKNLLRVPQPRLSFIHVVEMFLPSPPPTGINSAATVDESAVLASDITIDAGAVISAGAVIGSGCTVQSGAYIGPNVILGKQCHIGVNVALLDDTAVGDRVTVHAGTVIGGDGFGFVWAEDHHHKVPQIGRVVIEDDVEVGCNSCIDRATLGVTRIRRGTKIDNLVHIGHNNDIGEDVVITGQVGFSGSVTVGNRTMFGGQSGVADHVTIGEDVMVGGATAVFSNVAAGESVFGFPARPTAKAKREMVAMGRLPDLLKQLRRQEREMSQLRSRIEELEKRAGKV
ncbi:MAG: UDP-3-O-(3-hydroxymyristoyl)glucosamine N-acyltransferase [Sedimenticola sp.]